MMLWEKRHDEKEWPINLTCMAVVFCTAVNPELLDTGYQIAIPDRTEGLSTAYTLFRDGLIQQSASTSYPKDPENMADLRRLAFRGLRRLSSRSLAYILLVVLVSGVFPAGNAFFVPSLWPDQVSPLFYTFNLNKYEFNVHLEWSKRIAICRTCQNNELLHFVDLSGNLTTGKFDHEAYFKREKMFFPDEEFEMALRVPQSERGMFALAKWLATSLGARVDVRVVHKLSLGLFQENVRRRESMFECSTGSCTKVLTT